MYIFFVVSSTGLCIISSIGHVFHIKSFEFIGKRAIFGAIITILSGFAVIMFEIGHPIRMVIYNTISPGFTSAIWGMGVLYSIYLGLIILEFIFLSRDDHKWSRFFWACWFDYWYCCSFQSWCCIWIFSWKTYGKWCFLSSLFYPLSNDNWLLFALFDVRIPY